MGSVKYDIFWARLNSCPHTNTILYLNFESFELNQGLPTNDDDYYCGGCGQ